MFLFFMPFIGQESIKGRGGGVAQDLEMGIELGSS